MWAPALQGVCGLRLRTVVPEAPRSFLQSQGARDPQVPQAGRAEDGDRNPGAGAPSLPFLWSVLGSPPHTHTHTHHDFVRRLSRGQESCHRVAVSQGEGSWGLRLGTHDKARNILRGSGGESAGGAGPGTAGSGSESGTVTITASLIFKTFVRTNASHAVKSAAGGVRRVRGPREASWTTRSAPHARTCVCPGRLASQALPVSPWRLPPAASSRLQSLRAPRGTPAPVAGRRR